MVGQGIMIMINDDDDDDAEKDGGRMEGKQWLSSLSFSPSLSSVPLSLHQLKS